MPTFFNLKNSGKIFSANCPPHIAKKPRVAQGRGFSPREVGGMSRYSPGIKKIMTAGVGGCQTIFTVVILQVGVL